jgi:hypothetical protein
MQYNKQVKEGMMSRAISTHEGEREKLTYQVLAGKHGKK